MVSKMFFAKKTWLLAICIVLCVAATTVWAQGNIHIGRVRVIPGLVYTGMWNDNIFYEATNTQSDYISKVTPSILFSYAGQTADNYFTAGYSADLVYYSDFSDNNYTGHFPFITAGKKTPSGFYFRASDYYVNTADPYGGFNTYGIGENTKRWHNDFDVALGYEFAGKFAIEPLYRNFLLRYDLDKDQWQDLNENRIGLTFLYGLTPKTHLLVQYRYSDVEFDKQDEGILGWNSNTSRDTTVNDFFIGARFTPGGKLSGEIKLGFGDNSYKNDFDKYGNAYQDISTWVAETDLVYQMTAKTRMTFLLSRQLRSAPDDRDASAYTDTTFGYKLYQRLVNRLALDLKLAWTNDDFDVYPGVQEKTYNIFTIYPELIYDINKWFTASVGYRWESKDTSAGYEASEYDQNVIGFRIVFAY
jgi:hypothetical protein